MSNKRVLLKDKLKDEVYLKETYEAKWGEEKYKVHERILEQYFSTHINNNNIDEILIKVTLINSFYSTQIYDTYTVAKHILTINDLDTDLNNGKLDAVYNVARVNFTKRDEVITKNLYSFATKYCSFHKPEVYPIYDKYVERVLTTLKKEKFFDDFRYKGEMYKGLDDLKKIDMYKEILKFVNERTRLVGSNTHDTSSLKMIDKILWAVGKREFGV